MKLYVTYNIRVNGEIQWGSVVLHNIEFQFPPTEKNLSLITERIVEWHANLPSGYWHVNIFYILPLGEN